MARGSIARRSPGAWTLRVELEPDPATGRRRQKTETVRGTKDVAQARLNALLVEVQGGKVADAGRMTVGDLLDRFLEDHARPNLAPATAHGYADLAENQVKPLIGRVLLAKLGPAHVLRFKAGLRATTRLDTAHRSEVIATRTQRAAFRLLHTALAHAVVWRLIPANPAAGIPAPRMTNAEMRPFTAEQAAAVVAALADETPDWRALFSLALETGMRLGELCGLRWEDVTLDRRTVRVAQTIGYVKGAGSTEPGMRGRVTKAPKTAAGLRTLPIAPELVEVLRTHRADQNARRLKAGEMWRDLDLVFPGAFGRPLDDSTIRARWSVICARAKVPTIRLHDIRHTTATLLLLAGVNVKVVSERLGHATVAITMAVYSHVLPGLQEDAAIRIGNILRGRAG